MRYELISEQEYEILPEDKEQYFVAFENICRRNMIQLINQDSSQQFDRLIYAQYMAAVSAVAGECDIPNIPNDHINMSNVESEYIVFLLAVQREVAKIRARGHRNRQMSVQLAQNTRTKIEHYIDRIREAIAKSDLAPDRKQRLHDQLDELTRELRGKRLNFGKTMAILSVVMASMASAITIAADGPDAISNIIRLIGIDKESEDEAMLRLSPPMKSLPSPVAKPAKIADELDDDTPF